MEMKSALIPMAAGAVLLVSASLASAQQEQQPQQPQQAQQDAQPSARRTMVENANASAQSAADMSYGGVADTQSSIGGVTRPYVCPTSPRCNLYSKH
jgi:hypothetical protein